MIVMTIYLAVTSLENRRPLVNLRTAFRRNAVYRIGHSFDGNNGSGRTGQIRWESSENRVDGGDRVARISGR